MYLLDAGRLLRLRGADVEVVSDALPADGTARFVVGSAASYVYTCGPSGRVWRILPSGLQPTPATPLPCSASLLELGSYLIAFGDSGVQAATADGRWQTLLETSPSLEDPPNAMEGSDGLLFFTARTRETGLELWRSDGTPEGTRLVQDLNPGPTDTVFTRLSRAIGADDVVLVGAETADGFGLYAMDDGGMRLVSAAPSNARAVFPSPAAVVLDGFVYHAGYDLTAGAELFRFPATRIACGGCCDRTDCGSADAECTQGTCIEPRSEAGCAPPTGAGTNDPLASGGPTCGCRVADEPPVRSGGGLALGLIIGVGLMRSRRARRESSAGSAPKRGCAGAHRPRPGCDRASRGSL